MTRPVIGIIGNQHVIDDRYPLHGVGRMNLEAVSTVAGGLPYMIPADPALVSVEELMRVCHGFVLTGGRANVHPDHYGEPATEAHGAFDPARDAITLPLVRACVEAGLPIFGLCRGFQEMNVAMGGTLYPEIRDLPGRDNHRMPPDGTLEEQFALRHVVSFADGGVFHRLMGAREVMTNTLHGQGIKTPGARVVIEGHAPDGTAEAIHLQGAEGFALGVQWHPEWNAADDPVSRPLFAAFGAAARHWALERRPLAAVDAHEAAHSEARERRAALKSA
ncbi:gamma-glutamyl-gamma-aminobutyrate hydrolase family protein [Roseovarius nanhaiticus]|uniref:gamma-glutamyl-gamma-aminobutyrate hydrolase n=1 Tax=Roseovarius nanhaiticus TaxID=573024 RepID=A0A1N7G2P4_9RHOB|nr:gamma-glutamyl-gamma-aminobutyrate hydrolase family protein [Roseovarius nanhaiticus]SEK38920.1 putative glutamine amidotransferase [Roseovarius nanhaiticus]SIS06838.1 putative glutamine amidotransferase [Roseovarius nanhaiticus]